MIFKPIHCQSPDEGRPPPQLGASSSASPSISSAAASSSALSDFLCALCPGAPLMRLLYESRSTIAFSSRLDATSSGLILVGWDQPSVLLNKRRLASYRVARCYQVACHGGTAVRVGGEG